jgi:two-component system, cell cycle sensor histidine kinase and response regulator CckA
MLMSLPQADAESEVRQLKERVRLLEAMLRHAKELVFTVSSKGEITGVNEAVEEVLGYSESELVGRRFDDLVEPVTENTSNRLESLLRTKTGEPVTVDVRKERHVVIARYCGDRRALEESARVSQKMEILGVLAGGVAHDFNNLLTGILGYAYVLQSEPDVAEKHGEALEVIITSAERAAQLTTHLLGFARHGQGRFAAVDIHKIANEIVDLLRRTMDRKIRISAHLLASPATVMADCGQMYQVLLNLCINARDAMPGGGDLLISTRNSGNGIVISVRDTGTGIPESIRGRIFDTLFTTKPAGQGTGMGLAMVRAITRNHGGAISFESVPNEGTVFHVTLPLSNTSSVAGQRRRRNVKKMTGSILVIEEEAHVRQVLTKMLEDMGYSVTSLGDVPSGVEYFRQHHTAIDLVILDLIMPHMNGVECLQALRRIDPNVKAVLSTGSGEGECEGVAYLPKPYQPDRLAKIISAALKATTQITAAGRI